MRVVAHRPGPATAQPCRVAAGARPHPGQFRWQFFFNHAAAAITPSAVVPRWPAPQVHAAALASFAQARISLLILLSLAEAGSEQRYTRLPNRRTKQGNHQERQTFDAPDLSHMSYRQIYLCRSRSSIATLSSHKKCLCPKQMLLDEIERSE